MGNEKGKEEIFSLTTHSTHFIYGYMASAVGKHASTNPIPTRLTPSFLTITLVRCYFLTIATVVILSGKVIYFLTIATVVILSGKVIYFLTIATVVILSRKVIYFLTIATVVILSGKVIYFLTIATVVILSGKVILGRYLSRTDPEWGNSEANA